MDTAFLRKTFALIATGLIEKEKLLQTEPTRYPYSKQLQHGINMFLAASFQAGAAEKMTPYLDEAAFLFHFITLPIADWFRDWPPEIVTALRLAEEPFYSCEAFAYQRGENLYTPSSECYEFLETQDSDIMAGTDERLLYEKMLMLDQENYTRVRRFIIENPIITLEKRRDMSLELADTPAAREAFQFAYEEITEDCYRCPSCGWTMTKGKYGCSCHSIHCTDMHPDLTEDQKLDISASGLYRLKKGIMRYFAAPGRLELEIADFCQKKKLNRTLWPQMDRYDVEIEFSDGEVWEIDAKAYRNPFALRNKLQKDNGLPEGPYAKGFVVVPSEYTANQKNYTAVVNRALADQPNVTCVTLHAIKRAISEKEALCHEG